MSVHKTLTRPSDMEPAEWHALMDKLMGAVRDATPVKTGKLRDGWTSNVSDDGADVDNDVEYAGFVNDGTRHMAARKMTDALDEGKWSKVRSAISRK